MVKVKRLFCNNLPKLEVLQKEVSCYARASSLKTNNR